MVLENDYFVYLTGANIQEKKKKAEQKLNKPALGPLMDLRKDTPQAPFSCSELNWWTNHILRMQWYFSQDEKDMRLRNKNHGTIGHGDKVSGSWKTNVGTLLESEGKYQGRITM